jgi:hypothetical protein
MGDVGKKDSCFVRVLLQDIRDLDRQSRCDIAQVLIECGSLEATVQYTSLHHPVKGVSRDKAHTTLHSPKAS